MGLVSQASTTYDFYTDSGKDVTLFLDMHTAHVNGNTLDVEVDCEVKGQPAEGTELLAGVVFEETLYYLPDFTADVQVFSLNPKVSFASGKSDIFLRFGAKKRLAGLIIYETCDPLSVIARPGTHLQYGAVVKQKASPCK